MSEFFGDGDGAASLARAYERARDYLEKVDDLSLKLTTTQADIRARLGGPLNEEAQSSVEIVDALADAAEGAIAPTVGGRFFAYVIGGSYPVGMAADWLNVAWDDTPGTPLVTPFGHAVEAIVAQWVLDLLDLPRDASLGVTTGATMANFVGIAAGRHAVLKRIGWDVEADGPIGAPPITVIVGEEAHPTLLSALRFAGLGAKRNICVAVDDNGAMRADAFEEALANVDGPILVCAQSGNINSGAQDPFEKIAPLCRDAGAWLHVDGAFGLWARAAPDLAGSVAGVELADSWSTDAHKWLNTPYDAGFAIVRDAEAHVGAMAARASYLPQAEGARDCSHFVPELSRRGRATPIYATLRAIGRKGVSETVSRCCAHARKMRDLLTSRAGVECLNDVVLNQAAFVFHPDDDAASSVEAANAFTKDVVARVMETGVCWVQTSEWRGRTIMRFSVCNRSTTDEDIQRSADAILSAYEEARRALAEAEA